MALMRMIDVARACALLALIGAVVSPPLANVAAVLMLVLSLLDAQVRRTLLNSWRDPVIQALLAFIAVVLIDCWIGDVPRADRINRLGEWRKLLLFWFAWALFQDALWKPRAAWLWIGFTSVAALLSIALWALHWPVRETWLPGVFLRNQSTQSIVFGSAIVTTLAVLMFESTTARARRALFIALVPLCLALLVSTPGRSGFITALAGGAVLAAHALARRDRTAMRLLGAGIVLCLGLSIALIPQFLSRWEKGVVELQQQQAGTSTQETSMGLRLAIYQNTLELIGQKPFGALGTGAFTSAYGQVADRYPEGLRAIHKHDPHNQYLFVYAEHGPIGLAIFLWLLMIIALRARAAGDTAPLARALLAGWIATSMLSSHFITFSDGMMIWLMLGIFASPLPAAEFIDA